MVGRAQGLENPSLQSGGHDVPGEVVHGLVDDGDLISLMERVFVDTNEGIPHVAVPHLPQEQSGVPNSTEPLHPTTSATPRTTSQVEHASLSLYGLFSALLIISYFFSQQYKYDK